MLSTRRYLHALIKPLGLSAMLASLALGAPRSGIHPRLFFGPEDLPGLLSRVKTPQGDAIVGRLDATLAAPSQASHLGYMAGGWAVRHAILGDDQAAAKALDLAEEAARAALALPSSAKSRQSADLLPCASAAVGISIAYDLCHNAWPVDRRIALSRSLFSLATKLIAGSDKIRNQQPTHETAIIHAAIGIASLAVASDPGAPTEAAAFARIARVQVGRYLEDLGDRGWPREGFGNLRYAIGNGVGSFLLAWRRMQGEDLVTPTPARWWASLYATILLPPDPASKDSPPELAYFGQAQTTSAGIPGPRWELGPYRGGDMAAVLAFSDSASRAALQWTFDHCLGQKGDRSYDIVKPTDALFALLGLPASESSLDPAIVLGRTWADARTGVFLFRNQWSDSLDSLAAITANQRPLPIRSFADAGSFRLLALGGHWAVQREKDAADLASSSRERENVVVIPGTHGWQGGKVIRSSEQPDGSGAVSIDLDATYTVSPVGTSPSLLDPTQDLGIRAQRAWLVDYSGTCGAPVLMVVVDQIRNGPTRRWLMHTEEHDVKLHPDGFELQAANGSTLRATIIVPVKPKLRVDRGEWTDTLAIDGDGDFFVVMTVQPKDTAAPIPKREGEEGLGTTVRLGECVIRYDGHGVAIQ
ncbi:MAG: hypothetical protein WC378_04175 [Opitutaceae bacterium]|jgi:hypothetical protein